MLEMTYWYSGKGNALSKRIWYTVSRLKADPDRIAVDSGDTFGEVAVLSLPEGEYQFFSFAAASLGVVHRPKEPFSMPFTATRGRVTYIDNLNVVFSASGHSVSRFATGGIATCRSCWRSIDGSSRSNWTIA